METSRRAFFAAAVALFVPKLKYWKNAMPELYNGTLDPPPWGNRSVYYSLYRQISDGQVWVVRADEFAPLSAAKFAQRLYTWGSQNDFAVKVRTRPDGNLLVQMIRKEVPQ